MCTCWNEYYIPFKFKTKIVLQIQNDIVEGVPTYICTVYTHLTNINS